MSHCTVNLGKWLMCIYSSEKKAHSVFVGCSVLYMSIRSIWLIVLLRSSISCQIILSASSINYWEICLNISYYDGYASVIFPFLYFVIFWTALEIYPCNIILTGSPLFHLLYMLEFMKYWGRKSHFWHRKMIGNWQKWFQERKHWQWGLSSLISKSSITHTVSPNNSSLLPEMPSFGKHSTRMPKTLS